MWTQSSLADILESSGIRARPSQSNEEVTICCSYCPDSKYHLYINPSKEVFICFKCSAKGGIRRLFKDLGIRGANKLSLGEVAERIEKAKTLRNFSKPYKLPEELQSSKLPREYILLHENIPSISAQRAFRWLNKRGVTWEDISEWEIGFCMAGDYASHLILPIRDRKNRIVSFQARRFIGVADPKSKNPPSPKNVIAKTDVLYGYNKIQKGGLIVLVEGPFDVIHVNREMKKIDWPIQACALLGHTISQIQVQLLVNLMPQCVWVMMDGDAALDGRSIAIHLTQWVQGEVRWSKLAEGDPDDLAGEKIVQVLAESSPMHPFQNLPKREEYTGVKWHFS